MSINYPHQPVVGYIAPPQKKARKSWILNLCFLFLGLLTVCNLNAVAHNIFDMPQFLSPMILVFGLVGVLVVPSPRFNRTSSTAKLNLFLLMGMMMIGWIGLTTNLDLREWAAETYSICASIFVYASAAVICGRIAQTYGVYWLLFACFLIFGLSSASVFIGVISPDWNQLMSNAARGGRASGFFANPNEAGTQCCLFVSVGYALTAYTGKNRWLAIALAIAVPACFYTFSRGSFIALFLLSTTLSFFVFPPKQIARVMIAISLVIAGLFAMKFMIEARMEAEGSNTSLSVRLRLFSDLLSGRIDSETTNGRSVLAKEAIQQWLKSPLYGLGLGELNHMPRTGLAPHNLFLKILGETGLLGLGCFLAGLAAMLYRGLQHQERFCRVLIFGVVLSLMLDGMASHGGLSQRNFVFALGVAMGVDYVVTQAKKEQRRAMRMVYR